MDFSHLHCDMIQLRQHASTKLCSIGTKLPCGVGLAVVSIKHLKPTIQKAPSSIIGPLSVEVFSLRRNKVISSFSIDNDKCRIISKLAQDLTSPLNRSIVSFGKFIVNNLDIRNGGRYDPVEIKLGRIHESRTVCERPASLVFDGPFNTAGGCLIHNCSNAFRLSLSLEFGTFSEVVALRVRMMRIAKDAIPFQYLENSNSFLTLKSVMRIRSNVVSAN